MIPQRLQIQHFAFQPFCGFQPHSFNLSSDDTDSPFLPLSLSHFKFWVFFPQNYLEIQLQSVKVLPELPGQRINTERGVLQKDWWVKYTHLQYTNMWDSVCRAGHPVSKRIQYNLKQNWGRQQAWFHSSGIRKGFNRDLGLELKQQRGDVTEVCKNIYI